MKEPLPWRYVGTSDLPRDSRVRAERSNLSEASVNIASMTIRPDAPPPQREVIGLFAGIGGIEVGLHRAGMATSMLCEIEPNAQSVLRRAFPDIPLVADVREIEKLSPAWLLSAGFPCQDLSQAGRTAGISGANSGLVGEVLRLLGGDGPQPEWVLLENVPFMLQLDRGSAMSFLTAALEQLGFAWAYRVVDARSFGVPQRRRRILLLASRVHDPRPILFGEDAGPAEGVDKPDLARGFYWTEGLRGLGWAVDAVPTLKGGSTIGIPSPPAIWMPADDAIVVPDIRDAERMQGFDAGWTSSEQLGQRAVGARWKMVGNAVCVPMAEWIGRRLSESSDTWVAPEETFSRAKAWPTAAWGADGEARAVLVSEWPVRVARQHLHEFLEHSPTWLSARATAGFLSRARKSTLRFEPGFLESVARHLERVETRAATQAVSR